MIVVLFSEELVIVGPAIQFVSAPAPNKDVSVLLSEEPVGTVTTKQPIETSLVSDAVAACSTDRCVGALEPFDPVVSRTAIDPVGITTTDQPVIVSSAEHPFRKAVVRADCVFTPASVQAPAGYDTIRSDTSMDRVLLVAKEDVLPDSSEGMVEVRQRASIRVRTLQVVRTPLTGQDIVPAATIQIVLDVVTPQVVVASSTENSLNTAECVSALASSDALAQIHL
jgi:hypothetical protein